MPENLRDRIAAVIIDAIGGEYDHLRHSEALAAADAVIAALGIRLTGETLADAISRVDDWRGITDPVVLADAILASLKGQLSVSDTGQSRFPTADAILTSLKGQPT